MSAGVRRTPIHSLVHGSSDFLLVAAIIAKQSPRILKSKIGSSDRSVWNFTLRDSPADYINVSFWGSPEFVESIARSFHIGDVVDVIKAKVNYRKNEEARFMPDTTSPLVLVMNERVSEICLHNQDYEEMAALLRLPTRPPSDYLTLGDVYANAEALRGKQVNLLVAVRSVGALRQVTTKDGKKLDSREVEVMDQSPTSFYIQLWDSEMIYWVAHWKPRETVLFMADVKLDWNSYKKSTTGTVTSRTIITENPDIPDAHMLREHAHRAPTVPSAILDQLVTNYPEPSTINSVMSCNSVWTKSINGESAESFTALVFATVFEMDLDGLMNITVTKCQQCQLTVDDSVGLCMNSDCPVSSGMERPVTQRVFDIRVTLCDHTSSLPSCRLSNTAAVQALKCTPEEFDCLSLDAKTSLKWQYMLKRCASRLVVLPATGNRLSPLISVVAIEKVSLTDFAARLPMF